MNKIRKILEGTYNNPGLRKRNIPLFMGKTGVGKTWLIEEFAKDKGVRLETLILSQRNPFEISGMGMK